MANLKTDTANLTEIHPVTNPTGPTPGTAKRLGNRRYPAGAIQRRTARARPSSGASSSARSQIPRPLTWKWACRCGKHECYAHGYRVSTLVIFQQCLLFCIVVQVFSRFLYHLRERRKYFNFSNVRTARGFFFHLLLVGRQKARCGLIVSLAQYPSFVQRFRSQSRFVGTKSERKQNRRHDHRGTAAKNIG